MNRRMVRLAAACSIAFAASRAIADGPLVITHGGTYSGQWTSDDPSTPVIKIATKETVVIERSTLVGRGKLIDADAGGADVFVRDVHGVALNPNVADRAAGRFFTGDEVRRVVIEHCQLDGTSGIYVHRAAANDAEITISGNDARNIDGRRSDGRGGYRPFNSRYRADEHRNEDGFDVVQFVQLDGVVGLAYGRIAWNRVVNEPGRSRVEDNISLYESSGRPGSPIRVHDNCVVGGYTIDPSKSDATRDGWSEDWSYSGGGIMLGDGPGKTLATASGFIDAEDNLVLSTGNYGIAVAGGHDIRVNGNRVFASGTLADGRPVVTQNVGVYVWDIAKGKKQTPPTFYAVTGSKNLVGWMNAEKSARNDWWVPDATGWVDNVAMHGPVLAEREGQERVRWTQRAEAAGVVVGIRPTDR